MFGHFLVSSKAKSESFFYKNVLFSNVPFFKCLLKMPPPEKVKSHLLLVNTVRFQMSPQIACLRRGIVTLVAFVWLFALCVYKCVLNWIHERMHSYTGCIYLASLRRGIVTLVALVWLFSTAHFQMCPQIAFPKGHKVALVAFVWFYPFITCVFKWNIFVDPTFGKVISYRILIHCLQFS